MENAFNSVLKFIASLAFTAKEFFFHPGTTKVFLTPRTLKDRNINPILLWLLAATLGLNPLFTLGGLYSLNNNKLKFLDYSQVIFDEIFTISFEQIIKRLSVEFLTFLILAWLISRLFFLKNTIESKISFTKLLYCFSFLYLLAPIFYILSATVFTPIKILNQNWNFVILFKVISIVATLTLFYIIAVPYFQLSNNKSNLGIFQKARRFFLLFLAQTIFLSSAFIFFAYKKLQTGPLQFNRWEKAEGNIFYNVEDLIKVPDSSYGFDEKGEFISYNYANPLCNLIKGWHSELDTVSLKLVIGNKLYLFWNSNYPIILNKKKCWNYFFLEKDKPDFPRTVFNDVYSNDFALPVENWQAGEDSFMVLGKGDLKWIEIKDTLLLDNTFFSSERIMFDVCGTSVIHNMKIEGIGFYEIFPIDRNIIWSILNSKQQESLKLDPAIVKEMNND